jgi:hypothetical protein
MPITFVIPVQTEIQWLCLISGWVLSARCAEILDGLDSRLHGNDGELLSNLE